MKNITIYLVLFCSVHSFNIYSQEGLRVDSIYIETINPSEVLTLSDKAIYSYATPTDTLASNFIQYNQPFGTTDWNQAANTIYTYNNDNQILTQETQSWDGASWIPSILRVFTYDANGNTDTQLTSYHDGANYVANSRYTYTYNGLDQKITDLVESFSGVWTNTWFYTYTYTDGLLTFKKIDYWDGANWIDQIRQTITNTPFGEVEDIFEETFINPNWQNRSLTKHTYNSDLLSHFLYQTWDTTANSWVNERQNTLTYDGDVIFAEALSQIWDTDNNEWDDETKQYIYITDTSLGVNDFNQVQAKAYPNPFKKELNIEFKSEITANGQIELYDISGKLISKSKLPIGAKSIKMSNPLLESGIYLLHVTNENTTEVFKVIKQ